MLPKCTDVSAESPFSILGRRPAIIDGELGTDRAKDLAICCWGRLGHYAVDEPTLNCHAETVDIVGVHSTLLEHRHVHKDFDLLTRMQNASSRSFCDYTVMLTQVCPPEAFP